MDALGIRMVKHSVEKELENINQDIIILEDKLKFLKHRKKELELEQKAINQLEEV